MQSKHAKRARPMFRHVVAVAVLLILVVAVALLIVMVIGCSSRVE